MESGKKNYSPFHLTTFHLFYSSRMISIIVPVDPIPQPRPRFGSGKGWQPKRILDYKDKIRMMAMDAMNGRKPFEKPVDVTLHLYRRFVPTSRSYGDFDNLAKAICDALNGILYRDDSQIIKCVVEKHRDKNFPRVEIYACEV